MTFFTFQTFLNPMRKKECMNSILGSQTKKCQVNQFVESRKIFHLPSNLCLHIWVILFREKLENKMKTFSKFRHALREISWYKMFLVSARKPKLCGNVLNFYVKFQLISLNSSRVPHSMIRFFRIFFIFRLTYWS